MMAMSGNDDAYQGLDFSEKDSPTGVALAKPSFDDWEDDHPGDESSGGVWGVTKQAYGAANAFIVGGTLDTVGAFPAGVAGITALVTGAGSAEAAQVVEAVANKWHEEISKPVMDFIGPDEETDRAAEYIGEKMMQYLDGAAYVGKLYSLPAVKVLQGLGVDTMEFEALIDAESRAAAVGLMFAIGRTTGGKVVGKTRGSKPGFTAEEMQSVLNDGRRQALHD